MDSAAVRRVCLAVFRRKGASGDTTKPFDEFRSDIQEFVTREVGFSQSELPVVMAYSAPRHWVLVTTARVIRCREGEIFETRHGAIEQVSLDLAAAHMTGARNKGELSSIRLSVTGVGEISLEVEPGKPYFGLLNVLHYLRDHFRDDESMGPGPVQ